MGVCILLDRHCKRLLLLMVRWMIASEFWLFSSVWHLHSPLMMPSQMCCGHWNYPSHFDDSLLLIIFEEPAQRARWVSKSSVDLWRKVLVFVTTNLESTTVTIYGQPRINHLAVEGTKYLQKSTKPWMLRVLALLVPVAVSFSRIELHSSII